MAPSTPSPPAQLSLPEWRTAFARETSTNEFKTGVSNKPLQEALVALSNTDGGIVWIGVRDDGTILGKRLDQGTEEAIHAAAIDASQLGRYRIHEVTVADHELIAVTVDARRDEVSQTSDGRVLVRVGPRNQPVFGRDLWDLLSRRSTQRYEEADSGVPLAKVSERIASEVAEAWGWPNAAEWQDRWIERGFVHESGTLTIAGALIMTDPSVSLRAAKFGVDIRGFDDTSTTSYVRRDVITGPVQDQVRRATQLVLRDIGTDMVVTGSRRHDLPRLPTRAVREVIANAIAHRVYSDDKTPVVIDVRRTSIKVTSPGSLPAPVTVETLRQAQAPRNHTVVATLRAFNLAEDAGRGIDLIEDQMRLEMLAEPRFTATDTAFAVELPLAGQITLQERAWLREHIQTGEIDPVSRALLVTIVRQGRVTNAAARDLTGLDSTEVRSRLHQLRDRGLIQQHGTRGKAYYTLGDLEIRRSPAAIVLELARSARVTNALVREATGTDRDQARAILRDLVAEGRLVQRGARRGTYYELP